MATGFDRRHPRGVMLIRVLVTAWLLGLTGILVADGYWGWGPGGRLWSLAGPATIGNRGGTSARGHRD